MPVLFDSSVYISTLRVGRGGALLLQRWAQGSPLWLSSVVLQELYAGTSSNDYRALEKLERNFERAKRILIPNLSDWTGRKGSCTAGSEVWIRTNRTGAADERRVDCYQRSAQRYHRANDEPTGLCAPCGVLSSPVASPNGARPGDGPILKYSWLGSLWLQNETERPG